MISHAPYQHLGQLAISESEAIRLFGSNDAFGKTLDYDGGNYTIGAVFKDLPENTHFVFDTLGMIPASSLPIFGHVYLRLEKDAPVDEIAKEMTRYFRDKTTGRDKTLSITSTASLPSTLIVMDHSR